jgi:hypothetical protein
VDFVSGEDSIDISAFFSDPADLEAAVSDTGDDLVIALDKKTTSLCWWAWGFQRCRFRRVILVSFSRRGSFAS